MAPLLAAPLLIIACSQMPIAPSGVTDNLAAERAESAAKVTVSVADVSDLATFSGTSAVRTVLRAAMTELALESRFRG